MALTPAPMEHSFAQAIESAWDVAMYPVFLHITCGGDGSFGSDLSFLSLWISNHRFGIRRDVACNVFRSHDGQLRLSWGARSTLSSK